MQGEVRITVIATGFNGRTMAEPEMDASRVTPFKRTLSAPPIQHPP